MNRSRETMQFIQTRRYQRPHAPPLLAHARPRPGTKNYWLPFRCTVIAVASVHRPAASFHPLVATLSSVHAVHQLDTIRNVSTCAVTFSFSLSLSLVLTLFPVVGLLSIVEGRESRFCRLKPFAKADSSRTSDKKSMEDFSKENPRHSPKRIHRYYCTKYLWPVDRYTSYGL